LLFFILKAFLVFVFLAIGCAHPARGGTRKPSVPFRVHSVYKNFGFIRLCFQRHRPNPFLARGTVESPAQFHPKQFHCAQMSGSATVANQS
jgi:hypothetical protein